MPKHKTSDAYSKAFTYVVRLRRRYGFPAWATLQELDTGLQQHGPDDWPTWFKFLEAKSKGSTAHLRARLFLCVEILQEPFRWRDAGVVPQTQQDRYSDPEVERSKPALKKKQLPRKKKLPRKRNGS